MGVVNFDLGMRSQEIDEASIHGCLDTECWLILYVVIFMEWFLCGRLLCSVVQAVE